MNKIIGLFGEDPNDTLSIKYLLEQKISEGVSFELLIRNKRGYQLNSENTRKALIIECARKKPDIVIFIRDAGAVCTEEDKIAACRKWYGTISQDINAANVLVLNIYELEALIFANIDVFNSMYRTSIKGNRDITYIAQPKEETYQ